MREAQIERARVSRCVTVGSQDNRAVLDGARDGIDLREMGAAIRITRVGVGIIEPCLQPGSKINQCVQLEAVNLSFVGIDGEGSNTGIDDPLRISNPFLVHVRVNAHWELAQSSRVLDTELEVACDLRLE